MSAQITQEQIDLASRLYRAGLGPDDILKAARIGQTTFRLMRQSEFSLTRFREISREQSQAASRRRLLRRVSLPEQPAEVAVLPAPTVDEKLEEIADLLFKIHSVLSEMKDGPKGLFNR